MYILSGGGGVHAVASRRSVLQALAVVDTYTIVHDVRIKFGCLLSRSLDFRSV